MQTPSVGRIVLVAVNPDENGGQDYAPGIITRVWHARTGVVGQEHSLVNASVALDSDSGPVRRTSIKLYENRPETAKPGVAWWPLRTQ